MNGRNETYRCTRILVATVLVLCAVALALPVATVRAIGTEWDVARQGSQGYGTAWFVDPGEWYAAPAGPSSRASEARPANDGYGTAWFVDPGEWYMAPESPVFLVNRLKPSRKAEPSGTWYVDEGEWYAVPGASLAQATQDDSDTN